MPKPLDNSNYMCYNKSTTKKQRAPLTPTKAQGRAPQNDRPRKTQSAIYIIPRIAAAVKPYGAERNYTMGKNPAYALDIATVIIKERRDRSAWDRGVTAYALELIDSIVERAEYEKHYPETVAELIDYALNGARDWDQYSWGGCALVYDCDIAERLCCPSELKRVKGGERRPNAREKWLDTQARALHQAYTRIKRAWREYMEV